LNSEKKVVNVRGYGSSKSSEQTPPGGMTFTMAQIKKATKNFSPSNRIGQGAFGMVYKGKLNNGTVVAIKRAKKDDKGPNLAFDNEVSTLERIDHLNLVKFLGFLDHDNEQLIIVEYISNGTLREHLDCVYGKPLDFASRLDIAIDVAHAITYLHMYADQPIIHRDTKAANILLTDNLRAKVADFGFARLTSNDAEVTHVVTEIKGTVGYLDPEYLITNQLTVKSDVYSFGILLVELVSGRYPIHERRQTSKWAIKHFTEGNSSMVLDPKISQSPSINFALEKILKLASKCLCNTKQGRPTMKQCAQYLWTIRKDSKAMVSKDQNNVSGLSSK